MKGIIPLPDDDTDRFWTPGRSFNQPEVPMPGWGLALRRGLAMKCPSCGEAPAFAGYLTVRNYCPHCGAPLGRVPSDDAPPYITLLVTLHIVAVIMVLADRGDNLNYITAMFIFVPLIILLELALLRPVKGATIAILLKVNVLRPAMADNPASSS